jgi:hypothetical protein
MRQITFGVCAFEGAWVIAAESLASFQALGINGTPRIGWFIWGIDLATPDAGNASRSLISCHNIDEMHEIKSDATYLNGIILVLDDEPLSLDRNFESSLKLINGETSGILEQVAASSSELAASWNSKTSEDSYGPNFGPASAAINPMIRQQDSNDKGTRSDEAAILKGFFGDDIWLLSSKASISTFAHSFPCVWAHICGTMLANDLLKTEHLNYFVRRPWESVSEEQVGTLKKVKLKLLCDETKVLKKSVFDDQGCYR